MKKLFACFMLCLSISFFYLSAVSVTAETNGLQSINGKMFYYVNGSASRGNSTTYKRSSDQVRWLSVGEDWYLVDTSDGHLLTGWQQTGSTWYYMNPSDGKMQSGGMLDYNGARYFFASWGGMYYSCWYEYEGQRYYLQSWGAAMHSGWKQVGNQRYYFRSDGSLLRNDWLLENGKWYYLKGDGSIMKSQWLWYNNAWYYLKADGIMAANEWLQLKGIWYYFKSWGAMYRNEWANYNNAMYYLKDDGAMAANEWYSVNGKRYYFRSWGARCQNCTEVIAGKSYTFDANGLVITDKDWVTELAVAKQTNSLIVVKASGNKAEISMHEKGADNNWKELFCVTDYIGKNGIGKTREGDGKTPSGAYHALYGFGLADDPGCQIGYKKIDESYASVEDSNSRYYNQIVSTNEVQRDWNQYEGMYLAPDLYQYALFLDYNKACVPNVGSGIFIHCSKNEPTSGCISVPQSTMVEILKRVTKDTIIYITT